MREKKAMNHFFGCDPLKVLRVCVFVTVCDALCVQAARNKQQATINRCDIDKDWQVALHTDFQQARMVAADDLVLGFTCSP